MPYNRSRPSSFPASFRWRGLPRTTWDGEWTGRSGHERHGAAAAGQPRFDLTAYADGEAVAVEATLREWGSVTRHLGLADDDVRRAAFRAQSNATGFLSELLAIGAIDEASLFRAIADELGLVFLSDIVPERLVMSERHALAALGTHRGPQVVSLEQAGGTLVFVVAHAELDLDVMRAHLQRSPVLRQRLRIAAPSVLRAAMVSRCRERLMADAQYDLYLRQPELSARTVANAWQGCFAGVAALLVLAGLGSAPLPTLLAINVIATVTFLGCVAMRLLALDVARPLRLSPPQLASPRELPVYSVLVALYREKAVIPQLLVALGKLQWPHAKLEIKLVCEEDDEETLAALRAHMLRPCIEIVTVPAGAPRTKPKALCYALPLCSGEFVTLFDAEDRPHPLQLLEAWQRFRTGGDDLACLQAPLVVTNIEGQSLSRMFAFEYAGLFRGLLPWLSSRDAVLPLGGTSNHFRRTALLDVGGWDPYNVTEDADLGLRFKRFGYRTGVLSLPTFEDGPEDVRTWLPQRVRWMKGWLQTWLVHMRRPRDLWDDLGPANFLLTQLLFLGAFVSALVHPFVVATFAIAATRVAGADALPLLEAAMFALCALNLACGYGAFIAIGSATLASRERMGLPAIILLTPFYWVLLSAAAWMALWELYRRPHYWNKTRHARARPLTHVSAARATALR